MYHVKLRKNNREKRKLKIRSKIFGTSESPRLTVFKSNKYIYAQIIDDDNGITLVESSSLKLDDKKNKKKIEESLEVGKDIAKKALEKNIKRVVFDRNGYKYHGRVRALADGAREGGLKLWLKNKKMHEIENNTKVQK